MYVICNKVDAYKMSTNIGDVILLYVSFTAV